MGRDNQPKKIPTEVIVAIIGLIGIAVTAYFGYLQMVVPARDALHATQTAEQRASNVADTRTARAEAMTNTPTRGPTATPDPQATTAVPPTVTLTRTPRMGPGLQFCVNAFSINVRSGPGTIYPVIGGLTSSDCLFFDASNEDRMWLRIAQQDEPYGALAGGWVFGELLGLPGTVNLPAITLTPTQTPTESPTHTPTPSG
jgi:hypothetical protein